MGQFSRCSAACTAVRLWGMKNSTQSIRHRVSRGYAACGAGRLGNYEEIGRRRSSLTSVPRVSAAFSWGALFKPIAAAPPLPPTSAL
jgi:hypothetical protein